MENHPRATLADVLVYFKGNLSFTAKFLDVSRDTLCDFIESRPDYTALLNNLQMEMVDRAEALLFEAAAKGKAWAIRFILKGLGKKVGRGKLFAALAKMIEQQETRMKDEG